MNTNIIVLVIVIVCVILYILSEKKKETFGSNVSKNTIFKNKIPQIPDEQICMFVKNILADSNFQKTQKQDLTLEKQINDNNIIISELVFKQNIILNGINNEFSNMLKLDQNS